MWINKCAIVGLKEYNDSKAFQAKIPSQGDMLDIYENSEEYNPNNDIY